MGKLTLTGSAAAEILAIAGLVFAHKNQAPWDDHRVEGDLTTIHVQGNVYMIHGLGVSKQAASQLIDTLVVRGYLTREIDADDRRRMTITLTERGRGAAQATRAAVDSIDAELAKMITPEQLAGLRAGLTALGTIRSRTAGAHAHPHEH